MDDSGSISAKELSLRLANLEKIIERMFELPGDSHFMLEKKILQFENMIAHYPQLAKDLVETAQNKVISMWKRFYTNKSHSSQVTLTKDSGNCSETGSSNHSIKPSAIEVNNSAGGSKEAPNKIELKINAVCQTSALLPTPPGPRLYPTDLSSNSDLPAINQPKVRFDLKKCELRFSFEKVFAQMSPIDSGADVVSIKKLLRETARAHSALLEYPSDNRLHFDIFNMAFSKLPLKLREQFFSIYGSSQNGINLANLVALLQAEIVAQHSKTVWLINKVQFGSSNSMKSRLRSSLDPAPFSKVEFSNYCKYCKSFGHVRDACHHLKELLCFRCYQNGHTQRDCPSFRVMGKF